MPGKQSITREQIDDIVDILDDITHDLRLIALDAAEDELQIAEGRLQDVIDDYIWRLLHKEDD